MATEQQPYREPPLPLAMIICDAAYREPTTGKMTLLGLFSAIRPNELPFTHSMCVYFAFTDVKGKINLRIRVIDAEEEREPVQEQAIQAEPTDPRTVCDATMLFINLPFEHAGEYRIQAWAGGDFHPERQLWRGGEFLMERRLVVLDPEEAADER